MKKLYRFIKPFSLPVVLVLILIFFQTLTQLYLPNLMSDIVDVGIVNGDTNFIIKTGVIMLLVAAFGAVCTILASYLSAKIGTGFSRDLRVKIFEKVEGFSLHEFDLVGTASMITRTTNDVNQLERVLIMLMRVMVSAPMMAIGGIIMAVSKDAKLSLIIVVVTPILALLVYLVSRKAVPLFKAIQIKLDKVNLVLRENLTGIRVIRAFNRTNFERKRFDRANRDLTDTAVSVNRLMALMMPLMMLLLNFTTIAVIWFGGIRINNGFMQVGDLMAFIQYIMQIMFSFLMFSMMFVMIPRASASVTRINEVLDIEREIEDKTIPEKIEKLAGVVEFNDVTFSYPGAEEPAICNISFKARPGEITAIIGSTGSGKTTLINLIPRFYDVNQGEILIDNIDVRNLSQKYLRGNIGFVPQNATLFSGTIAENIRYGMENAAINEIKEAAEIAQAYEFISELEDGYNTVISQGGTNLSGGQKQRLAIARSLVRKPLIYIFDDCFSALDFKTDAKLRNELKKETVDSTVIIVVQRVSTVMDADQIIVLDEGQIAGIGSHQELLNNCDVYREIVLSQFSEEEIA